MKQLHRKDLFGWSVFDQQRNLDFHSVLWVRDAGNVLVDPLPLTAHDREHLLALGGARIIVVTNSDHIRDSAQIALDTGAQVFGPAAERGDFALDCDYWVNDQDEIVSGLRAYSLDGSKTPGELALVLENEVLITGDLIRCHTAGELCLLPDAKLSNREQAIASVKRLADMAEINTVLTGDGWPVFNHGGEILTRLARSL